VKNNALLTGEQVGIELIWLFIQACSRVDEDKQKLKAFFDGKKGLKPQN
jgi:hypothetical protein|tara:strand:- start:511 stop:657 length:147 start_codon:yes stop_codon:yes gene_type:complete